jgi:hypothetical protein
MLPIIVRFASALFVIFSIDLWHPEIKGPKSFMIFLRRNQKGKKV